MAVDDEGITDKDLDDLYDTVERHLQEGEFTEIDALIRRLDVGNITLMALIGWLAVTLPAKDQLPARPKLFKDVEAKARAMRFYSDDWLRGLE
jgi:hypothetical protein